MKTIFAALILALPLIASADNRKADAIACATRHPSVDRKACMLEMRNARAMKEEPVVSESELIGNILRRCDVLPPFHRDDCTNRILHGRAYGSVEAGGVLIEYRELEVLKKHHGVSPGSK